MKLNGAIALLAAALLVAGLSAPTSALAQNTWRTMHPNSFAATAAAAVAQCDRTAAVSQADALTGDHCDHFSGMLAAQQCEAVQVSDGTHFAYMNYRRPNEQAQVQGHTVKQLGENDTQALRCDLGDGVVAYWFNEPGAGCNNVAFQMPRRQTTVTPTPQPPAQNCRLVAVDQGVVHQTPARTWAIPIGQPCPSDCTCQRGLNGNQIVTQITTSGSTIRSSALVRVCD